MASVWVNSKGYPKVTILGVDYYVHRLVWAEHNGEIPNGMMVDHIDGDPSNYVIDNLRLCTRAENGRNRVVTDWTNIRKRKNRYQVRLRVNGKEIHVGSFKSVVEARAARDEFRKENYGEFNGR